MDGISVFSPKVPGGDSYGPAVQVNAGRLLFISGQIPETTDGHVPSDFAGQCRLAWENVLTVLKDAGMGVQNLVKVTVFLSHRRYRDENAAIRQEFLGGHRVALTIVISEIYDPRWLLEIEAVAAAPSA